jgi:CHAD domain-containing protein
MRCVLNAAIEKHVRELVFALGHVHSIADRADTHAARISAKRLRYLLEPFEEVDKKVADLVMQLTKLQDALGEIHDSQTFAGEVAQAAATLATEEGDNRDSVKGLVVFSRRLHHMETAAFSTLKHRWLDVRWRPGPLHLA